MSDRPGFVLGQHGGTGRWHEAPAVWPIVQPDGGFWARKGQQGRLGRESVPADTTGSASR